MDPVVKAYRRKFSKEMRTGLLSLLVMTTVDKEGGHTYGYAIIKTLETVSGGKFKFPEGTIYPILSSLEGKGLLTSSWGNSIDGPRRKYYTLTPRGREALENCLDDWRVLVRITDEIIEKLEVYNR